MVLTFYISYHNLTNSSASTRRQVLKSQMKFLWACLPWCWLSGRGRSAICVFSGLYYLLDGLFCVIDRLFFFYLTPPSSSFHDQFFFCFFFLLRSYRSKHFSCDIMTISFSFSRQMQFSPLFFSFLCVFRGWSGCFMYVVCEWGRGQGERGLAPYDSLH